MGSILSRRSFLAAAAGTMAALAVPKGVVMAADRAPDFQFPLLGDIHYDRLTDHAMDWLRQGHPGDVSQVENYSRITTDCTLPLFQEIKATVRSSLAPIPFVAHVGDLVEGLCGAEELARTQCKEALDLVQSTQFGVPFYMTKGNHDITGPGARESFDSLLKPALSGGERDPKSASFLIERGDTLVMFFDCYGGGIEWAEHVLASRTFRTLIFIIHEPVVPYNARSNWIAFARADQAADRQRLLNLLGRNKAVVLSGHLHKYSTVVRKTDAGPFVQLGICSVIPSDGVAPRDVTSGVENYNADLVSLEPHFSPSSLDERRDLLTAEKPSIRYFDYADTAGYAVVSVRGGDVTAAIFNGLGRKLWKTVELTRLRDEA